MRNLKKTGFTLVELIVVITIGAILATIAYVSLIGYSQHARNSSRVSDVRLIEKALGLFISIESIYPLPDDRSDISYWWATLSFQWNYGSGVIAQVWRISAVPSDPTTESLYSYGVTGDRSMYQLWSIIEWGLLAWSSVIAQTYALSNSNMSSYTIWDYSRYDIGVNNAENCRVVTMPSILLSEIPAGWVLIENDIYKYSYLDSPHLPSSYSESIDITTSALWFQLIEVLDKCRIESLTDLELYIAQLSTAYQPLADHGKFEQLIFNSDTNRFQKIAIHLLQQNGIEIAKSVINELNAPLENQIFVDTFTDIDNTFLVTGHSADSLPWSWSLVSGGDIHSYSIVGNKLLKNNNSLSFIYPDTTPALTSSSYRLSFDIENFAWSGMSVYLRYTDNDNYYRWDITATGYQLTRRVNWVDSVLQNITETIDVGSRINFWVDWDTLSFWIDDIQKESILVTWVSAVWIPALHLYNSGSRIDNFTLTYQ